MKGAAFSRRGSNIAMAEIGRSPLTALLVRPGSNGVWHVKTVGPERDRIVDLFGSDTLPTPWTSLVSFEDVVDELRKLNPGAYVPYRAWSTVEVAAA